jgi:hypothetical protein
MCRAYPKCPGKPKAHEVDGEVLVFWCIYFVDHENHPLTPSTQPLCKFQIQWGSTTLTVDHKEEHFRAFNCDLCGGVRLLRKVWIRTRTDTAGVDYLERDQAETAHCSDAIASYAGLIMNNCNLAARETVE